MYLRLQPRLPGPARHMAGPSSLDRPRRLRLCAAARRHQSPDSEHRGHSVPLGAAAQPVSAQLHPLLRQRPLVRRERFSRPLGAIALRHHGLRHFERRRHLESESSPSAIFCAALFVLFMVCHGELARRRPAPAYLTSVLSDGFGGRRHRWALHRLRRALFPQRALRSPDRCLPHRFPLHLHALAREAEERPAGSVPR